LKIILNKIGDVAVPYSEEDLEKWHKFSDAVYEVDMKNLDSRTIAQNSSLHLWAAKIARVLNANGLYMTGVFGNKIEWSMNLVKEQIIKATIKKVFNVDSTTKLKRKEIDEMIDYVTIVFASKGVEIPPFPSKELWNDKKEK
jgi:hypothetical protein